MDELTATPEAGGIVLGPAEGCADCMRGRRTDAGLPPKLTSWCRTITDALKNDPRTAERTRNAVLRIDATTLEITRHRFLSLDDCRTCGGAMPQRSRALRRAGIPVRPGSLRTRDLAERRDELLETYVDSQTGVVKVLRKETDYLIPIVSAPMPDTDEVGWGREVDYCHAGVSALAEALERLGGRWRSVHGRVKGTFRELENALDPRTLGVDVYAAELSQHWVPALSAVDGREVLVPESAAYYFGVPARTITDTSNGCALGSSPEEAVLHGLLELVERDAFLLTWLARRAVPRIDLTTVRDRRILVLAQRIQHMSGHDVEAFATTVEHGIPTVWVMAVGEDPAAVCAAGVGFDPEQALFNAMLELTVTLTLNCRTYSEALARPLVFDPYLVRDMRDHSLLYGHQLAFPRFDFLFDGDAVSVDEAFADAYRPRHDDLAVLLAEVVDRLAEHGLETFFVDQTRGEHRAGGFSCVRVIVPGMVPMTFGHQHRRGLDLPRVTRALAGAPVNHHPHPFP